MISGRLETFQKCSPKLFLNARVLLHNAIARPHSLEWSQIQFLFAEGRAFRYVQSGQESHEIEKSRCCGRWWGFISSKAHTLNFYFPDHYHVKTNTSRVEIGCAAKLLKWPNALFGQRSEIETLQIRDRVSLTIESVISSNSILDFFFKLAIQLSTRKLYKIIPCSSWCLNISHTIIYFHLNLKINKMQITIF